MEDVKTFLKVIEPMMKNVGSWDNARLSRAIVVAGYRNTIIEDIHENDATITNDVREEIMTELTTAIKMVSDMQPLIEQNIEDIEECMLNMPEDVNEWIATYLNEMEFADACSSQWDAPSEVPKELFEELDDELCDLHPDKWAEVIANFILAGQFSHNQENNIVLTDSVMAEMNRDLHNRMFTVLEHLDDCLYGIYG